MPACPGRALRPERYPHSGKGTDRKSMRAIAPRGIVALMSVQYWKFVGYGRDAKGAKLLKLLVLPRGLEPLFPP